MPVPAEVPRPQPIVIEVTEIKIIVGEVTDPQPIVTEPVENGQKKAKPIKADNAVEVSGVKEKIGTSHLNGEYRKGQYQVMSLGEPALSLLGLILLRFFTPQL